jgi:hypothetical protein
MSKVKNTKNKLKSKIEAIKKINDEPQGSVDSLYDKYFSNVPTSEDLYGNKLDDFLEKRRTKKDNKTNIFEDIMDIADSILSSNTKRIKNQLEGESESPTEPTKSIPKRRLRLHAETASQITLENSKEIILDNVKKHFFASDGICGTDQTITIDSLNLKPQEFDFLNVLTVDPNSATGRIVYEPTASSLKAKVNTNLYASFGGTFFDMRNTAGDSLFEMIWDVSNQEWNLSGLTTNVVDLKVEEFLNDYYSSIELPDIEHIIKTSMLMTIQSGESNPLLEKGLNNVNRLLNKLMSVCGSSTNRNNLSNQTAVDLFDENDQDMELYFDFDDVEGIDLDDEDNRYRKVLKFTDCNNFEAPVNKTMLEDFVYLGYRKNTGDLVDSTINRAATDAYLQSNGSIPQSQFNLNILNLYILNLPKALLMSAFSPKIFLPIIVMYKILKVGVSEVVDVVLSMKNLSKLFIAIVKDLFWFFLREFWRLIKVDLLAFVMTLVTKILKNKYKRYIVIITALIAILTQIVEDGIDNCFAIFTTILSTIQLALSSNPPFNIPGILLGLSDRLPGYSQDRAYLNIVERLENAGISTGPIFGEDNNLPLIIKSIIDGNAEEIDTNSFVSVSNKEMIIPTPFGPVLIPPGLLNSSGKVL